MVRIDADGDPASVLVGDTPPKHDESARASTSSSSTKSVCVALKFGLCQRYSLMLAKFYC